jgi:hypothetical protein
MWRAGRQENTDSNILQRKVTSKYQTIQVHALVTCFILQVHSARDTATANNVNTGKFTLQSTAL